MSLIKLGDRPIGPGEPCFVVAEVGINHGGNLTRAFTMINAAAESGADAVKFQKRTVDLTYTAEELARPRESPFGTTNGDLKRGLEFGQDEYERIDAHCRTVGIPWFASAWDIESVAFLAAFGVPVHKVPSALLTDLELIHTMTMTGAPILLSTGMSGWEEIQRAVQITRTVPYAVLACTATYPCPIDDLHLSRIPALAAAYGSEAVIGYSGHEVGLFTTLCAVALGAQIVERHFTLDRSSWGSDQAASIEPHGFAKLVREIRDFERAFGRPEFRCLPSEQATKAKLRRLTGRDLDV